MRIIGMVHLQPLAGAPRYGGALEAVIDAALADARALVSGGVDAVLLENFGDVPFLPDRVSAATIAQMAVVAAELRRVCSCPIGVNVLRNDALSALAVAFAARADFIRVNVLCGARVTDQGIVAGRAAELARERRALGAEHIRIFADVDVKHSAPLAPRPLADEARDLVERAGADALVVSGPATGQPVAVEHVSAVRGAARRPVYVGSGVTAESWPALAPLCDGAIIGTAFKRDGVVTGPVDPQRVRELIAAGDRPRPEG